MTAPVSSNPSRFRLTILLVIVGCLFAALLARLWFLQVVNASSATAQVDASEYVDVYVPAPRGEILDRTGKVLVGNRQIPVITVEQQEYDDAALVARLAALLGTTPAAMKSAIDNDQYTPYAPVPVSRATAAEILYVDEHQVLFPGVQATTEDEPYATTLGQYAGDVVGYVGQIDSSELKQYQKEYPDQHYEAGDIVGQTGIEAEFQPYLNGTPGVDEYEVNGDDQVLKLVRSTPPVPGDNVVLALDAKDQEVADTSILEGQAAARAEPADTGVGYYTSTGGSAVVEDPRNGQILALASEPTFNPNWFNEGITESEYESLSRNPDDPLLDRAIDASYAPGSTFKLVTATAQLHYGVRSADTYYDDTGEIVVAGHVFHDDADSGAGEIDLSQALTVSSDNYFNTIGEDLWDGRATYGPLALQKVAYSYGFGEPTDVDLPYVNSNPVTYAGLIPTPAQQVLAHKENPGDPDDLGYWVVGDSIEMAIGQFQVQVTPLQLADAYATFANGGTRYKPQLVLRVTSPSGKVIRRFGATVEGHSTRLSTYDRAAMIQGYLGVTHDYSGTGYPVFAPSNLANADIAGKTGTAQVQDGQDTSVFTSFGPATDAKYVVDCFMENSGYGESIAAPIVRRIWDQILHKSLTPVTFQGVTGSAD